MQARRGAAVSPHMCTCAMLLQATTLGKQGAVLLDVERDADAAVFETRELGRVIDDLFQRLHGPPQPAASPPSCVDATGVCIAAGRVVDTATPVHLSFDWCAMLALCKGRLCKAAPNAGIHSRPGSGDNDLRL